MPPDNGDDDEQPELFNIDDICRRKHGGELFSELANPSPDQKRRDRLRIILHIRDDGPHTTEEIERNLHMRRSTASARMSELKRDGMIVRVGTRPTTTGASAGVYDLNR